MPHSSMLLFNVLFGRGAPSTDVFGGFSMYSVMTTRTLFTTTSVATAELRSTFFSLGLFFFIPDFLEPALFMDNFDWFGDCLGGIICGANICWAFCCSTTWAFNLGFLVDVPFLTSQISHLNASALFRYVQTLQSQYPASGDLVDLFRPPGYLLPSILKTKLTNCVTIAFFVSIFCNKKEAKL